MTCGECAYFRPISLTLREAYWRSSEKMPIKMGICMRRMRGKRLRIMRDYDGRNVDTSSPNPPDFSGEMVLDDILIRIASKIARIDIRPNVTVLVRAMRTDLIKFLEVLYLLDRLYGPLEWRLFGPDAYPTHPHGEEEECDCHTLTFNVSRFVDVKELEDYLTLCGLKMHPLPEGFDPEVTLNVEDEVYIVAQ